jgi:uncharacterized protein (TIGR03435 family)
MMRMFARVTLLLLLSTTLFAQSDAPGKSAASSAAPAFEIADVHASPARRFPFMEGGTTLRGDRLVFHQATMLDLIAAAYGLDPSLVTGGPSWLETNRFEVIAKTAPTTSKDNVKLMLQSLLADRFKLVVHHGSAPLPAYALTVGRGSKPKLKDGDSSAESDCQYQEPPKAAPGTIQNIVFVCTNTTMEQFANDLHDWAGGYLTEPVVDSTGLKGAFDFDIKWTGRGQLQRAGADGISIFDAVDKQLGLKLDLQTAPRPVLVVDSVSQSPTPNSPDLEKILPTPPPAQFEVATIKPSQPGEGIRGRINGNQVDVTNSNLKFLINFAWDLNPNDSEQIANAPKWLDTDHFDILAKVAAETQATGSPNAQQIDIEDLRFMIRSLIEDRFQMKAHMEDRPIDAYTLIAVNPKLRPADPTSRTRCKEGPGPDGKDPRIATPILGRLLSCQNMTAAQIADELQRQASGYIFSSVLDKTGLQGSWDFTLSFSTAGQLQSGAAGSGGAASGSGGGSPSTDGAPSASEPNGAVSLFDAVNHQLGLKLEKQRRPAPVLVIEHIEEKPTEN